MNNAYFNPNDPATNFYYPNAPGGEQNPDPYSAHAFSQGAQTQENMVAPTEPAVFWNAAQLPQTGSGAFYPPFASGSTVSDPRSFEENGRTWQNYRPDRYFLPNDAIEQDRLDFSHRAFLLLLNGRLSLAPFQGDPPRVLDIGTGTGIWAIEFAKQHPGSRVIGSDLSLIQPDMEGVVPNVEFVREDAEELWVHDEPFDFIHSRLMFSCYNSHRKVIQKAYDHLKPGGWIEYHDFMYNIDSDDGSHRGTALHKWSHLANAGAAGVGRDFECARKYQDYMRAAGFVDVVEKRLQLPGNPWPRDEIGKQIGRYIEISGAEVVDAISAKLLGAGLGLPPSVMDPIVTQAALDVHNQDIHFYWPGYVVYGRKPYEHENASEGSA